MEGVKPSVPGWGAKPEDYQPLMDASQVYFDSSDGKAGVTGDKVWGLFVSVYLSTLWRTNVATAVVSPHLSPTHIYTHQSVIFSATQETSLLGRGEWIKFAAAFFNLDHVADKKFEEVR